MESNKTIETLKEKMDKAIAVTVQEFKSIRTGRASASLLDRLNVDYYGTPTPIKQIANISVPEPQLLTITPWDKTIIPAVEKAIQGSDLGVTPSSDGNIIRLNMPPLTEDRRREFTKVVHNYGEDSKIALRNIRREAIEELKYLQKNSEITEDDLHRDQDEIQKITDLHTKKIDEIVKNKQSELMTV